MFSDLLVFEISTVAVCCYAAEVNSDEVSSIEQSDMTSVS